VAESLGGDRMMRVIVPCVGYGQRFRAAGYTEDKPLIRVCGKHIIEWAVGCLPPDVEVHFVVRRDQEELRAYLDEVANGWRVHVLDGMTEGAALSVLSVAVGFPKDEPVAVMNADQWFDCDVAVVESEAEAQHWNGFILTFPGSGPQWSYAVTDDHGFVTRVLEKIQVGDHATVGFYWWRQAGDLVRAICRMVAADDRTKGEFYLAPAMNYTVDNLSRLVKAVPVRKFLGLGTPEQVHHFVSAVERGEVHDAARTATAPLHGAELGDR